MTRSVLCSTPFGLNPQIGERFSGEPRTGSTCGPTLPRSPRPWRNRVHCPNCKHELPVNASLGLCPMCLLTQGMDVETLSLSHRGESGMTARWSEEVSHRSVLEVLKSVIGEVPSVLLRDTETGLESPVVRPSSPEMPTDRGRYQLLGEIARGGMGAVLKGRDPDLGRDLAVKVLLEEHRDQPDLVRRFVEEAQIGGQLQHPGVVPVYELGSFGRPPALLHHEAGQGPHAGGLAERARRPARRPAAVPGASSRRSARRWPTRTPAA